MSEAPAFPPAGGTRPVRLVILGAGPAGLTAAWENVRHGGSSVVLEKDGVVGGIARTVQRGHGEYGAPGKSFSIGLGCDLRHAARLVYSKGLDLGDAASATPIGAGCRVCERPSCPQRAFPPIGRALTIDENRSRFAPYPTA